jgi:hypothetical protein
MYRKLASCVDKLAVSLQCLEIGCVVLSSTIFSETNYWMMLLNWYCHFFYPFIQLPMTKATIFDLFGDDG